MNLTEEQKQRIIMNHRYNDLYDQAEKIQLSSRELYGKLWTLEYELDRLKRLDRYYRIWNLSFAIFMIIVLFWL